VVAIGGGNGIELHVVGRKARAYGGVHRVCNCGGGAKEIRPAVTLDALAPDRRDPFDAWP
jgi:hypothetical protein